MKTRINIHIILCFVAIALPISAAGQDSVADVRQRSLQECLQAGLERNYGIKIVRNSERISDNNATWGNAGFLPQASISAGYNGSDNSVTQHYSDTGEVKSHPDNQTLNASVNLSWTLFNGFSVQTSYKRLKELQQMGELNTRLQIENFISEFTAAYYNYVRQYIRQKNLRYAVELSAERVRIVEARYNIGALSKLDLQQANVDLNADKSNLLKQNETLHTLRTSLNEMMAMDDIEQPLTVADSLIEFNPDIDREAIRGQADQNNIYLKIARKEGDVSKLDLKAVQSRNYPYLTLNAGYGYTGNWYGTGTLTKQQTLGVNYGLTLGFTLFDGMNRRREIRNAKIAIENSDLSYKQTEQSIMTDLSNAWMSYVNNMGLVKLERDNLATARDNYQIAIERYKLGQLSGIELREAQNSLLEAEERLVQAEYDTKLCEISLLQIGGMIGIYVE